ncbi:MAG TPA: galactose oxidase, partial [Planctomycetia bacterium]|nr:galactose oxidase [Planctomycetia bacterium]
ARRHYQNSFRLHWRGGALQTEELPPLPFPIANGCAALVGGTFFVCGGQKEPTGPALDSLLAMDLEAKPLVWRTPASRPGGGRILSIAASAGGEFWSIGGATIEVGPIGKPARRYQTDVYSYKEGRGWRRRADLPAALAAAPSPAPTIGNGPAVLGGDDGTQASLAPERHRGFSKKIWVYDTASERWKETDAVAAPRVTTGIAEWRGGWAIPSGEVRPGIRSSEVWRITFKK